MQSLTDNEGSLLVTISRHQPVTAYRITMLYQAGPVCGFNESMGQVYPAIRRLSDRGLICGDRDIGDRRRTVKWWCTGRGEDALRDWVRDLRPRQMMLADPLHAKVLSLELMAYAERLDWLSRAKVDLTEKLSSIETDRDGCGSPYENLIKDGLLSSARARMDWLDRVFVETVKTAIPNR